MAALDEKNNTHSDILADDHDTKKHAVVATKTALGDEAFQQALLKEPPKWFSAPILVPAIVVAFCCSTANGYDGSLFGALLASNKFKDFFGVQNDGIGAGIVTSIYQIGSIVSLPFVGPFLDTWGRRPGMFIGAAIIILGVIIQCTCVFNNAGSAVGQFMAGRFFLGFGVQIASSAGPVYVVEMVHPAHRGLLGGLYNVMWPVGALVSALATRFSKDYPGTKSWMIPLALQCMFPSIIVFGSLFLPESPRWLYTRGRQQQATELLATLHGNGRQDSEWVKLQLQEYEQFLEMDGTDKRWWDYSALWRNRASMYRLGCNCIVATFGQLAGNSIVSYYLSAFLDTAGITNETTQMNLQLGMNAVQILCACVGSSLVDRLGRRPMLIFVNIVCGLCWVGVIVPASIANVVKNDDGDVVSPPAAGPVSAAILAWVYIFQISYSVGWTPLQALYPVEVLSYEMRGKGMAFSSLFMNAALLTTQFGVPVALKRIQWRTYIVFCIWCFVQSTVFFFLIPETKNRTLEELDHIFSSPNPVKTSTEKKLYEVDSDANVVNVDSSRV